MDDVEGFWNDRAAQSLVGRKIVNARYMSQEEADNMGWYSRPIVFELDNGSFFFPSRDDEGNGAGALFGQDSEGGELDLPVIGRM